MIWTLPYAALEGRALVAYLVLLPFAAAAMEPAFPHLGLGQAVMLVMVLAAGFEMLRRKPLPVKNDARVSRHTKSVNGAPDGERL